MYLLTLLSPTSMPSLRSSPWVRKNSIRLQSDRDAWYLFVRLPLPRKPKKPVWLGEKHFSAGLTVYHPGCLC